LQWEAADFRTRLITVRGPTAKTELTRHVPMTNEVMSLLSRWRAQGRVRGYAQRGYADGTVTGALVFPGRARVLTGIKTAFKPLLRHAGIEKFRVHDLRHTYASHLVQRGVSLFIVQKLMGHSSPLMTQRYSHLQPNHLADAVAVLDRPASVSIESEPRAPMEAGVAD
jgi:integrase